MTLSIIAAVADNGTIGSCGRVPWHLPYDLERFKRLTMGRVLIVGRKTFEGIGRSLPGREMIVLTRSQTTSFPGVTVARSLPEALRHAGARPEAFVGGGAEVYRQALPLADRLVLTLVHTVVAGDVCFPEIDERVWRRLWSEPHQPDTSNPFAYTFVEYARVVAPDRAD